MKCCIKILAVAALVVALAFAGCKAETEIESLTQEQMVSKLDEKSKDIVYEAVLAGKNAESLLAKLTDTQKAALFDKMLTDEKKAEIFGELLTDDKKNEIYNEKLTDEEKAKIFDGIITDKRTSGTFLELLTDAEKQAVYNELLTDEKKNEIYNEKLTDAVKAEIFNEIFAGKRTDGKVVELLNEAEKSAIFDTLLAVKTSKDFIVGILTKEGNETLYAEIKAYLNGNFTQAELVALLNAETKTGIYEEILAGKNAEALLAKLSDEQKAALFDKMLTADKKNAAFEEILAANRAEGKVVELLNETEKASVFDTLLATKTSKDFIVGILTKTGNETLYAEIKTYITASLTKEELAALLAATDTTAPAVVQALTATSKDTGIELTWTDPSDADLWGFVVGYYEAPASRALVLDSTRHEFVVGKSQNVDKSNKTFVGNLTDKKSYIFYIKSVDENFNVSEAKESVSCTYNEKFVEVEKKLEAGTYTVYHFQQKITGGKAVSDYVLEATENNKSVAADSTIVNLKKTYTGFTEKTMSQNEKAIYIFYDRNTITYTFQTGTEGKFEDGTTSKEVSGLYGTSYSKPKAPTSGDYNFVRWQDSSEKVPFTTFGAEDKTWTAVWRDKSEGPTISDDFVGITYSEGDFYISKTELTYTEWYEVYQWAVTNGYIFQDLGREGSNGTDGASPSANSKQPVTYVSWRDAVVWCNAASEKAGLTPVYEYEGSVLKEAENYNSYGTNTANTTNVSSGNGKAEKATVRSDANGYRLPTEAEWEYAAKGGANFTYSGSDNIDEVAWYSGNSGSKTHDVGTKDANGYELHDMSGNVWEWCQDTWSSGSSLRVRRGGGCNYDADICAVSFRNGNDPVYRSSAQGFRVVRSSSN